MKEGLYTLIENYGYIALFCLLAVGILGLPVPAETLMVFVGSVTIDYGPLTFMPAMLTSFGGSMTGMIASYYLGKGVGKPFLHRFGKWLYFTPPRIARAEKWFQRYGVWTVSFGYFIPVVRHFTCYLAGASGISFWKYSLYAGAGALIWCSSFIALGHLIGTNLEPITRLIHGYVGMSLLGLGLITAIIGCMVIISRRKRTS